MQYGWYDLLGNLGVGLIIGSYLLLQLNRWHSRQLRYSLVNALGAALVIFSLLFDFNLSAFLVEFFWLLISLMGVAKCLREKCLAHGGGNWGDKRP